MTTSPTNCSKTHTGISNISFDILIHIQSFLEPPDTISLRKTCKYLFEATSQRAVWLGALQRICASNGLFLPSFPMEQMSIKELENAALAPRRFSSMLMDTTSDNPMKPHLTHTIETYFLTTRNFGEVKAFRFIPGGRYLVTHCEGAILFWDLGVNIRNMIPPSPLAYMASPLDIASLEHRPTTDGLGVLLFFVVENAGSYDISVYAVYPLSSNPDFIHIASLKNLQTELIAWRSTDFLFAFLHSTWVTVWNFKENAIVTWDHQTPEVREIGMTEEHVILFQLRSFSLYSIPPLHPCDDTLNFDANIMSEPHHSQMDFAYNSDRFYHTVSAPSSAWFPRQVGRQIFGFVAANDSGVIVEYYLWKDLDDPDLPKRIPVLADSSDFSQLAGWLAEPSMHLCDQYVMQAWSDDRQVSVVSSLIPTRTIVSKRNFGTFKSIELWKIADDLTEVLDHALCPATGRLCVMTDGFEIHMIDYLAPFGIPCP